MVFFDSTQKRSLNSLSSLRSHITKNEMTSFLILPDATVSVLEKCNGDLKAMQQAVGGYLELVAIEPQPNPQSYPFDIYLDEDARYKHGGSRLNMLGAFVMGAAHANMRSFGLAGVIGPVLITAREDPDGAASSLSEGQVEALKTLCEGLSDEKSMEEDSEDDDEEDEEGEDKAEGEAKSQSITTKPLRGLQKLYSEFRQKVFATTAPKRDMEKKS